MKTIQSIRRALSGLCLGFCALAAFGPQSASCSPAPQDDTPTRRSELGERQRFVERKMVELENKFTVVAEKLKETEPEQSKRLINAYQLAKEKLITRQMTEVGKLLDQGKHAEASAKIDTVIEKLDELVLMLTNRKKPKMSKQQEIDMLQDWKNEIDKMRNEQTRQRRETSKVANKQQALDRLKAQIKQLNKIIDEQKNVIQQTQKNTNGGVRALDKVADTQFGVRKKTEELAEDIASEPTPKDSKPGESKPGESKPGESKPGESKPGESKPGESKPGESKPGESKPGESKPGESKPGESKPGESKPGESNPGESKPGESKPGESKSGNSQQNTPPQPGQKPLQKATEHQRKAEEKLGSGRPKEAKRQQEDALTKMEEAKRDLNKEFRRLESLPPEAFEQMAQQQRRNRDKALELNKKMAKAPKPQSENQDNQNASQQPEQQPGQKKMQEAGESMKKASEELDQQNPDQAEKDQKKAEKKLDEARKEIEERLSQLRDETMEEKLKQLESRFREMQDRQRVAGVMTTELDDKTTSLGQTHRRDVLTMIQLANEELEISELGRQAYDLLLEDATSDVMPNMVLDVCESLGRVTKLLESEQTNQFTQLLQHDIEMAIQDLLDAMAEAKKKNKQNSGGGGGGGGGGKKQPLIKPSTELKILRAAQMRLNRRTSQIDSLKENGQNADLDRKLNLEIKNLADQQRKLLEMTERVMEKDDK